MIRKLEIKEEMRWQTVKALIRPISGGDRVQSTGHVKRSDKILP